MEIELKKEKWSASENTLERNINVFNLKLSHPWNMKSRICNTSFYSSYHTLIPLTIPNQTVFIYLHTSFLLHLILAHLIHLSCYQPNYISVYLISSNFWYILLSSSGMWLNHTFLNPPPKKEDKPTKVIIVEAPVEKEKKTLWIFIKKQNKQMKCGTVKNLKAVSDFSGVCSAFRKTKTVRTWLYQKRSTT